MPVPFPLPAGGGSRRRRNARLARDKARPLGPSLPLLCVIYGCPVGLQRPSPTLRDLTLSLSTLREIPSRNSSVHHQAGTRGHPRYGCFHALAGLVGWHGRIGVGGNAFDAAVAAGLTLQVAEPHVNGPGGEVPIIFHSAERAQTLVIAGQGPAPAAASIARFEELGLDLVPGTGLLAACVPGAFDTWMVLLGEFGTLRLSEVMRYAIDYAGHGYPLVPRISDTIGGVEKLFRDEWTSSAEVYLRGTGVPRAGTLFSNPDLASTFRRIVEEAESRSADRDEQIEAARDAFYRGFIAEAIVHYVTSTRVMDTSGRRHAGLLSGDDLAAYRAELEGPATLDYHGYTVCKTGLWGQGPVFLQQLALLAGFDLVGMGHNTVEYIHTVVECAKLAFADREAHYGDPRFVDALPEELLHPSYAEARRELIGEDASFELRPGAAGGRSPRLPDLPEAPILY